MPPEPPQTLLFDLGNVLFPFQWDIAVKGFAEELNKQPADIKPLLENPDYAIFFYEFGTGRMSVRRFVKKMNEFLGSEMDRDTISKIWCSIFSEDAKMTGLLKKLSKDYKTFIVSDTDTLHWDFINGKHKLEKWVRGTILSFRRGNIKTDPGVFHKILMDYKFDPGNTVFIDDLSKNVSAAEKEGIRGIVHRGYASTLKNLRGLGIKT